MNGETKGLVVRENNAAARFVESVVEQFGFSADDASRILLIYRRLKLVRLDPVVGQFALKDGRFWDHEVMQRALAR